jgi:hypothetical protein
MLRFPALLESIPVRMRTLEFACQRQAWRRGLSRRFVIARLIRKEIDGMSDWLWFIAAFIVYLVLMRWVLPRLGVPT